MSLGLGHTPRTVAGRVMSLLGLSLTGLATMLAAVASIVAFAASASPAAAAEHYGVKQFLAGTCNVSNCEIESEPSEFFTQAAGHPPYGITEFQFLGKSVGLGEEPVGNVRTVRVDLPAGLSVNPYALPQCPIAVFKKFECPADTRVGTDEATAFLALANLTLPAQAYNLEPAPGLPAEFGVSLDISVAGIGLIEEQIYLEGGLSWHPETGISGQPVQPSGDYHEYFVIKNIGNEHPLLASRLIFEGNAVNTKGFITMPSSCDGPQTTYLETESYNGEFSNASFTTHYVKGGEEIPMEATGCNEVPFEPKVEVTPSNPEPDKADGATVKVTVPQSEEPQGINSSTVKDATVTLPEGMTLNPAAASGLAACTTQEFGKGTAEAVACPEASQIGTAEIETPMLPPGSLQGGVYIGEPIAGRSPSSGEEYRVFIAAESLEKYNLAVRLEGRVKANEATGQLTTLVTEAPPLPFSEFALHLEAGERIPLANPLTCGTTTGTFVPYSAPTTSITASSAFTIALGGHNCPVAPFEASQSTASAPSTGGADTSFTFNLNRPEGGQYISQLSTTLPEGLVGEIPAVPLCGEPQAAQGSCPSASKIGTASVTIGSGAKPYGLSGSVYLTGPYDGAPYGMSIAVPAEKVGPYDYGTIVTRAKIEIDPYTARVTVASSLPTVVGGAPIRLRSLSVAISHSGFLINPTSCSALATETSLVSTFGANTSVSTPFQASGCEALPFKPKLSASSNAKTSRKRGASLAVTVTQPASGANIRSVAVTLPRKLVARLETLNLACTEAQFAAGPSSCPAASKVGSASVATPVLPDKLSGSAYFVSRGKAGFPNLDVVLEGDGVHVIVVGDTNIKGAYTHSTFASVPDIPFSRFQLKLPMGRHSALSANGSLCKHKLAMPTTIVAQNGKTVKQKTKIAVAGCKKQAKKHAKKSRGDKKKHG
ncbi:MAG TPA: hypothetical protein VGF95_09715 [Solirubrobacteraceae bacterium]|jgi:hypothetical protein